MTWRLPDWLIDHLIEWLIICWVTRSSKLQHETDDLSMISLMEKDHQGDSSAITHNAEGFQLDCLQHCQCHWQCWRQSNWTPSALQNPALVKNSLCFLKHLNKSWMGVTKAPFIYFSNRAISYFAKLCLRSFESQSYLSSVNTAELHWYMLSKKLLWTRYLTFIGYIQHLHDVSVIQKYTYIQLTHCGLVTPYGHIDLGQHWLR